MDGDFTLVNQHDVAFSTILVHVWTCLFVRATNVDNGDWQAVLAVISNSL